jgi:glycine hydroxymethyltransferase
MGVLGIYGPQATRFLDLVTTNFAPKLRVGQAHYAYILDPSGGVLDDVFIYRLGVEDYQMVVNAVNDDKVKAWLWGVNEGRYVIDERNPWRRLDCKVKLLDLRAGSSGNRRRIDLALQGPASRKVLVEMADTPEGKRELKHLRKMELTTVKLGGIECVVARTGYTGEEIGYEIFVHPGEAPALWRMILKHGEKYGVSPAGLGARDSLRTEAGFPLYGHELAGKYNISPLEAGYGSFVKKHKTFFIGREPLLKRDENSRNQIIRFRVLRKGVRTIAPDDVVVTERGQFMGVVTSCVLVEGYQLGLAYVQRGFAVPGNRIGIFTLPRREKDRKEKPKWELSPGDKVLMPVEAVILPRFRTQAREGTEME